MATDLIRTCDVCRRSIPAAAPVAVLRADIFGRVRAGVNDLDICSEPCAIATVRRLWTEATSAPGADAREVAKLSAPNHRVAVLHCCQAGEVVR